MGSITAPREFTEPQLNKAGVSIVDAKRKVLKCLKCEGVWSMKKTGLRLPKNYWGCPNGCNKKS